MDGADDGAPRTAAGDTGGRGLRVGSLALAAVFEDALPSIPVSSNKSMIGHTITAAGAVEAVFSVLSLKTGRLPPTINLEEPDPTIPLDLIPDVARDVPIRTVMSNSFGFGGQNVSLLLSAEPF